jgi:hypothetical protein
MPVVPRAFTNAHASQFRDPVQIHMNSLFPLQIRLFGALKVRTKSARAPRESRRCAA